MLHCIFSLNVTSKKKSFYYKILANWAFQQGSVLFPSIIIFIGHLFFLLFFILHLNVLGRKASPCKYFFRKGISDIWAPETTDHLEHCFLSRDYIVLWKVL